jgi:glucose/arabinose dehydrogenase
MLRARTVMVPVVAMVVATLLTGAAQPQEPVGGDMGLPSSSSSESSQSRVAPAPVEALGEPVQNGFEVVTELSGLNVPTAARFSPDGRVFVAEKAGRIKVFDSLDDATPTTLQLPGTGPTYDFLDRGFLGLALDPNFLTEPWVYGLHTRVHDGYTYNDDCPGNVGCMADGRLFRFQISPTNAVVAGTEQTLIAGNWCQQFTSHSIGTIEFGPDGELYVGAGDGASFVNVDYGQFFGGLIPRNPCGDAPVPVGGQQEAATSQGGAIRSQDPRVLGDSATFDGSILRVNPDTGAAFSGNPGGAGDDRIVAYGLRNPFRFTVRPGTNELWIGDVGWDTWEEIDRHPDPTQLRNFGWPCYEGGAKQSGYDGVNNNVCETLYASPPGTVTAPYFSYRHGDPVAGGCANSTSSISGLAFYEGGDYPDEYDGALFFADYSRGCIFAMLPGSGGLPSAVQQFVTDAAPVNLEIGPDGDLFYVDIVAGTVERVRFTDGPGNNPPTAEAVAEPDFGPAPLTVQFDGSGSSDPDGDTLAYAWDLNGDGQVNTGDGPERFLVDPTFTYPTAGLRTIQLRVRDTSQALDTDTVTVDVGNTPPTAAITSPATGSKFAVGQTVSFAGTGSDAQDGPLPASAFSWKFDLHHCAGTSPTDCHVHPVQTVEDVSGGSFVFPDHEYFSWVEMTLTVTDSDGATSASVTRRLDPKLVELTFRTDPVGLRVAVGAVAYSAPETLEFAVGSTISVSVESPQTKSGVSYKFESWSHGKGRAHELLVPGSDTSYTARFEGPPPANKDPVAEISASDTSGIVPFTVRFDGGDSSDPEGDSLSYSWDLDGDGSYDDSKSSTATRTFTVPGAHLVRLKVGDGRGGIDADRLTIMAGPQPVGASFSDVPVGYVFYEDIEWLLAEGITEGCDPAGTLFCPTEPVTRGQMAAFLVRYLGLTDPGPGDWFVDDDGSIFESEIDRLAQAGITLGCNPPANDRFCPLESVTRGQMATFLDRALDLPAAPSFGFTDIDNSVHREAINRLAAAEITLGCTDSWFCPELAVSRGQMAAFLHRGADYR